MPAARSIGIIAVIAAAILWGTTGTIQTLLPEGKEPIIVGAMRIIIGALTLIMLAMLSAKTRNSFRLLPLRPILLAGLGIAVYNIAFFIGVLNSGVGIGTAITVGSAPIWVTLYEIVIKRQFPHLTRIIGQTISISGALLLVLAGGAGSGSVVGFGFAALAGAAYAAYSVITSQIGPRAPSVTTAAATFSIASLFVLPVFLFLPVAWMTGGTVWLPLLFLGVVSTGVSYVLYTWGLNHVTASTAVTLALAEPLTAWVLAIFVVGENVSAVQLFGAIMLMVGLAIVTAFPAKPKTD
ncbi:DMT family transporter [Hyphococcus sp. DH-69]|uniref:DMT family transporter n=1 Tax=Hyphococcus formosus TaxID=3143534 RepID=UPI00398B189D